ncbi:MAG: hypothetical protein ABI383_09700 [Acidobacteriaceae bacterium]
MTHNELLKGYQKMAADKKREREAEAWAEGLIGDGSNEIADEGVRETAGEGAGAT